MSTQERITAAVKDAMRARARDRLGTLRLVQAAIKQYEVDERHAADDAAVLAILNRMLKQRQDSITQYRQGGREDLAAREEAEVVIIREFLPEPLSDEQITARIAVAVAAVGASSLKDMGAVMAVLKPELTGRADMAAVSKQVRAILNQ